MVISHEHRRYISNAGHIGRGRYNGAYYYSQEICRYIIPSVRTGRNWVTINIPGVGVDHAIVFIHNNLHPEHYDWLSQYDDLILVCGVPETCEKVSHLGKAIYLPLSVKVSEVEKYKREKDREVAYIGRKGKRLNIPFPVHTDFIEGLPRDMFLTEVARYRKVYAIGRAAIEAKILSDIKTGEETEILPYDERFPDPTVWKVVDSGEAAKMLQAKLNEVEYEL